MSRTVPRTDSISRINRHDQRIARLERNAAAAVIQDAALTLMSTSSTSFTAPTGAPSVCTTIGANADCIITLSSTIDTTTAGDEGQVGISVDGASAIVLLMAGATSTPLRVPASITIAASALGLDLTPGQHTLEVQVCSAGGHTVNFIATSLVVQPL